MEQKLELEFRYVVPYTKVGEKIQSMKKGGWTSDYKLAWSDCLDTIGSLEGRLEAPLFGEDKGNGDVSNIGPARIEVREKPPVTEGVG